MKKIIERTCGKACPVVKGLKDQIAVKDHEIACLKLDLKQAQHNINVLAASKRENERRMAKARQALFGIVDINIVGGP